MQRDGTAGRVGTRRRGLFRHEPLLRAPALHAADRCVRYLPPRTGCGVGGWRHLPAHHAPAPHPLSLAHLDHRGADPPRQGQGQRVVRHPRRGRALGHGARGMSKTAIVTGGARGIGRGCALELAARGYDIALVDLLEPEMARTKGEIEAKGRKALAYKADVALFARAHEIAEDVAERWGRIDF